MLHDVLSGFGRQLLELVLPMLATAIAGLLVGILTRYLKKVGLEVDAKQEARLKEITIKAINAVEERARREAGTGGAPTSGGKNEQAFDLIKAQTPKTTGAEVQLSIDAQLPEQRAKLAPAIVVAPIPVPATPATFGQDK